MAQEIKIIKGPDGFYCGRILKTGLPSADTHKVTDEEICAMFEDLLRRNRMNTGRSVLAIFTHGKPAFMAKLEPHIMETGVIPMPQQKPMPKHPVPPLRVAAPK